MKCIAPLLGRKAASPALWFLVLAAILWFTLLNPSPARTAGEDPAVRLTVGSSTATVNHKSVALGYPVHIMDGGVSWASVRPIVEGLGGTVAWQDSTRQATVTWNGHTLRFTTGSATASVNGQSVTLSRPVHILNGKMQVPLRTLGEGLGFSIGWQAAERAIVFRQQAGGTEPSVSIRQSQHGVLGPILVDQDGKTLYIFTRDENGTSSCYGTCVQNWPPLISDVVPAAAAGINGDLGLTTRQDGSKQVTFNNMPLYYFINDQRAGDANGQGLNQVWYVLDPNGNRVTTQPTAPEEEPQPAEHTVTIRNFAFAPANLEIHTGDTVTWINEDSAPHTATGDSFDSGILQQGESFSYTFEEPGDYDYICSLHPSMEATVVVRNP